jgi:hypothetical protein
MSGVFLVIAIALVKTILIISTFYIIGIMLISLTYKSTYIMYFSVFITRCIFNEK